MISIGYLYFDPTWPIEYCCAAINVGQAMKSKSDLKSKSTRANRAKPLGNQLNAAEAKAHFSRMIHLASRGESFLIAKAGTPVAKVVPPDSPRRFKVGWAVGLLTDEQLTALTAAIAAPLPEDALARLHDVGKFAHKPLK
jgi:antitoxin (DNA-binding transcriptional repressor) of toxin-antitoxin stability system